MLIVRIHNDGTGDVKVGNYDWDVAITVRDPVTDEIEFKTLGRGRVEGHERAQDWRALVRKVAKKVPIA